jgi:hypothetical protein
MRTRLVLGLAALAATTLGFLACGGGFDPQSQVDSVRMFATRANTPYAKPGAPVTLEALYTDARKEKPRAAVNYWIPLICMNPAQDAYYACFIPSLDGGASGARFVPAGPLADAGAFAGDGGGADGGVAAGLANIPTDVDLGPFLPQGATFSFTMPTDAVQPRQGSAPYGLAVVFNILCAGRVTFASRDPNAGPQQVPVRCTDENGVQLSPKDYVLGISRVYAYADRTNTNPIIQQVTLEGLDVDPLAGITVPRCTAQKRADCQDHKIDIRVSDGSWEQNPDQNGNDQGLREQIWVDYYSDIGDFSDDARLLFDATKGRSVPSEDKYHAPNQPGDGTIWAVVHDNRGGVTWIVLPLHVQ